MQEISWPLKEMLVYLGGLSSEEAITAMRYTRWLTQYKTFSSDRTKFVGGRMGGNLWFTPNFKVYDSQRRAPVFWRLF